MGSCTIKFDGNEYNYQEFATKLRDGLLQELIDSKAVDISKFKGEIPSYIKIAQKEAAKQEVKTGLSENEQKYKEDPASLSKEQLKDVLASKRERLKRAYASLEKGELSQEEMAAKKKGIAVLEKAEEDLIKRIDAGIAQKIATKDQAMNSESIPVKNPVRVKKSLENLKEEFADDEMKMRVIDAVEKGIAVLKAAFPSMNIILHRSNFDFFAATGIPMINGNTVAGAFIYSGDAKSGYEGAIHINLMNSRPTVVYHEIAHALMLKTLGENKALFDAFKNKVSKVLSDEAAASLDNFIRPYPESDKAEEYIVQLVASLTTTNGNTDFSILMKLKLIINEFISKITGGKIKVFEEEATGAEVFDFLKEMAATIKEGRDIETLQQSFNDNLFEPTSLNIIGVAPSDIPSTGRYPKAKASRGDYEMVDHPIVNNKILKGKPIAVTMSDHTKVGMYKNLKSGVEYHGLMGGVFYPYIKGIREAGLGWASVTTKAARSLVANALNTDYTVVYRMARATGSQGNVNFGDIAFLELTAPVTNKQVSEKEFLTQLNDQLKKVKAGVKFLEKYGVNGSVTSIASLKKGLSSMSFSTRGQFWKVIMKGSWAKKSTGTWYQFLEKHNVASLEDIVNGLAEMETDTALDHDVVAVLKIDKPEYTKNGLIKIYTTRKELVDEKKGVFFIDAPDHPSYPYVVKGEPVGILDEFANISEYFPIIKQWIASKRLNSPYKAVETMGKELITTRINQLESEKESLKADLKAMEKTRKDNASKLGFSALESEEQIRQRVKNDKEYFGKLVRYAVVSIELGLVKSMNQLREAFKKDIGIDFTKGLNKELGLVYNTAKAEANIGKKPTIKQTIKAATEVKTDQKITMSFSDFMSSIYKSENKGFKTKKELTRAAFEYLKKQNVSALAVPKILKLIDRIIELKSFDSFNKSFADYVDYYVSQATRLAKVREAEQVASKLKRKITAEKLGQITPQAIRLANLNLEFFSDAQLDSFISLANDLLTPKLANVESLKVGLEELVAVERAAIENGIENNLFSDKELVDLLDKVQVLNEEMDSPMLKEAERDIVSKKKALELNKLLTSLDKKKAIIMSYIDNKLGKIEDVQSYLKLLNSIRQYNTILDALHKSNNLTSIEVDEKSIRMSNKNLTLLEQSLKEKLDEFRTNLIDDTKKLLSIATNQFVNGGLRAKLFASMSAFDKAIYTPILTDILYEKANEILDKLDISDLDMYNRSVVQLLNGYISPKLRELNEIINATYVREDMDKHIDNFVEGEYKFNSFWKSFSENWMKSIKDFKTDTQVIEYMQTKNWQSIADRLSESGLASIYEKYIYPVIYTAFTPYLKARKDIANRVNAIADKVSDKHKIVLGIFMTQLDLMRYENWNGEVLADVIINKYEDKELSNVSEKRMADLIGARKLINGNISTKEGLLSAMNEFFKKDKNAKTLYNEIRSAIDNKIFGMTKMNIEREGGYVEFDGDYFPIQRVGRSEFSDSSYEDLFANINTSNKLSTRSSATFKRVGDPLVMREFDVVKAFDILVDDVTKNYYLRPVIVPLEKSIASLANKYGDKKSDYYDKDIANFLKGIRGYVHRNLSLELSKMEHSRFSKFVTAGTGFSRNLFLANLFSRIRDFISNIALVTTSGNPIKAVKYLYKQEVSLSKDDFASLAELTNSPIIFNKSIRDIEDQYSISVKSSKKRMDAIAAMSDVPVKRKYWKAIFLREFEKLTKSNFDADAFKKDSIGYYLKHKEVIDKVARLADYEVDKKFSGQLPISHAMMFSLLPAIPALGFKGFQFKRKSTGASMFKYMTTYVAWGSDVALNATYRLSKGDVKGFIRDITPLVTQSTVFAISFAYAKAAAAVSFHAGQQLLSSLIGAIFSNGGDDDDDEKQSILEYAKEQFNWANSTIYKDNNINWGYIQSVYIDLAVTLGTSKYAVGIKDGLSFVLGLTGSAHIGLADDKKAAKETWSSVNDYYRQGFKSGLIYYGKEAKRLNNMDDAFALIPVVGATNNILGNLFNEKDKSSAISLAKGISEGDLEKAVIGTGQLGALLLTYYGIAWAPTAYAGAMAEAKLQGAKDAEAYKRGEKKSKSEGFGKGFGKGFGGGKGF